MSRIRLAYLPASLRPGGAERQMLALAERLPNDRFQVDFLAIVGRGSYDERAEAAGSQVSALGSPARLEDGLTRKGIKRVSKIMNYVSFVRRARYDIVDAWLYPADVMAALARPLTQTPVVMAGRRNVDLRNQFGIAERLIGAATNRLTDVVVANSAAAAAVAVETQGVDPAKIRIIRNGVIVGQPSSSEERAFRRQELGATDNDIVVGCVANYREVKGLDRLIEVAAALIRDGLPIRLELIGDGDLRPQLERQISATGLDHRICLHGSVLDVQPLYAAFDVVVQASVREGLPNVMLEAAAAARPIVATAAGGTSEIIIDGQTGLLVPVNDSEAMASALRHTVTDPGLRTRLGRAARDHVSTTFGMDRFVAEFADLYETLVASRRRHT